MAKELKIHPIQKQILISLLFRGEARFSDLNLKRCPTDQFTFHLKELLEQGLLKKNEAGEYSLTKEGKEFANRFDTENLVLEKQAKLSVIVVAEKSDGKMTKRIHQQRLKHPYYGYYGFVSGKIRWGETVLEAAARELKEETGLTANLEFAGIEHKTDYQKNGELLEDKFFYIVRAKNPKGNFVESFDGGKNFWLTEKELLSKENVFEDVVPIIRYLDAKKLFFFEKKYTYSQTQY